VRVQLRPTFQTSFLARDLIYTRADPRSDDERRARERILVASGRSAGGRIVCVTLIAQNPSCRDRRSLAMTRQRVIVTRHERLAIDRGKIPATHYGPQKVRVTRSRALAVATGLRGELAGCNCIKLAVTRPCINHSCGPRRTAGITHGARTRARVRVHACERATHRSPRKDRCRSSTLDTPSRRRLAGAIAFAASRGNETA
jgi:hypothetical protein